MTDNKKNNQGSSNNTRNDSLGSVIKEGTFNKGEKSLPISVSPTSSNEPTNPPTKK